MTLIVATQGFIIEEVPISFEERRFGKSKLDFKIIQEALKYLFFYRFKK